MSNFKTISLEIQVDAETLERMGNTTKMNSGGSVDERVTVQHFTVKALENIGLSVVHAKCTINDPQSMPILDKNKYLNAVMSTQVEGRTGRITDREIRSLLERTYDAGTLYGVGREHGRPVRVAVVIEGGTISRLCAERPGVEVHKFDIDEEAADRVLYKQEEAEFDPNFNANKILKALESKFN